MKTRIRWVDVAKGIAIISIVLGHLANRRINSVAFTFHVPVFFFLSGYFLNLDLKVSDFVKKKAKSLLVPYLTTCIVICLLSVPLNILQRENWIKGLVQWLFASVYGAGNTFAEPFYIPQIGAIWFLLALFWGEVFLRLLMNLKKGTRVCILILIFALSLWSARYLWLPFSLQAGGCALIYIYAGHLFRQVEAKATELSMVSSEANFVFFLFMAVNWIWTIKNYEGIYFARAEFLNGVYDIWGNVCGVFVILILSKLLADKFKYLPDALSVAGRNSLLIMCVHVLELNLVPWEKVFALCQRVIPMSNDSFIAFIVFAKVVFICVGVWVVLKIPFLRRWYGYK